MKRLQITLFVIAFVILGTQSFRHLYVKWIEPRSSVLDSFRVPVDTAIASATSLGELVAMYEQAHSAVQDWHLSGSIWQETTKRGYALNSPNGFSTLRPSTVHTYIRPTAIS